MLAELNDIKAIEAKQIQPVTYTDFKIIKMDTVRSYTGKRYVLKSNIAQSLLTFTTVTLRELAVRRNKVKKNHYKLYQKLTNKYMKIAKSQKHLKDVARGNFTTISDKSVSRLMSLVSNLIYSCEMRIEQLITIIHYDREVLQHSYLKTHKQLKAIKRRMAILADIQKHLRSICI